MNMQDMNKFLATNESKRFEPLLMVAYDGNRNDNVLTTEKDKADFLLWAIKYAELSYNSNHSMRFTTLKDCVLSVI